MKAMILSLALSLLSYSAENSIPKQKNNTCIRWLVSIQNPNTGLDVAKFLKVLQTDRFQPALSLSLFSVDISDDDSQFNVIYLAEAIFKNVGLYTPEQSAKMRQDAIETLKSMPNVKVKCDGLSGGGGHLSGSN